MDRTLGLMASRGSASDLGESSAAPHAVLGIVLAGGRSRRFGSDKLEVRIGETSVLGQSIQGLLGVADRVVVLGREAVPVRGEAVDYQADPSPFEGPLVALAAGLDAVDEPIGLVVGGDMPWPVSGVLRLLVERLVDDGSKVVAALTNGDRLEPLPIAIRIAPARSIASGLVAGGERSLRSFLATAPTIPVSEPEWRELDPEAATLRDIDTPEDLDR
jgi:molybdenum cofactor guanylyltransferase